MTKRTLSGIGLSADEEKAKLRFFFVNEDTDEEQSIGLELALDTPNEEVGQRLIKIGTYIGIWTMPEEIAEEGTDAGN